MLSYKRAADTSSGKYACIQHLTTRARVTSASGGYTVCSPQRKLSFGWRRQGFRGEEGRLGTCFGSSLSRDTFVVCGSFVYSYLGLASDRFSVILFSLKILTKQIACNRNGGEFEWIVCKYSVNGRVSQFTACAICNRQTDRTVVA